MTVEVNKVKELGEQIGYGHMMNIASALWRKNLADNGYPTSGAFITTCLPFINDDYIIKLINSECETYDKLISV